MLSGGLDPKGKHFVSVYGGESVDAALLLLPIGRFIAPDDPRFTETIRAIRERLGAGPFV